MKGVTFRAKVQIGGVMPGDVVQAVDSTYYVEIVNVDDPGETWLATVGELEPLTDDARELLAAHVAKGGV